MAAEAEAQNMLWNRGLPSCVLSPSPQFFSHFIHSLSPSLANIPLCHVACFRILASSVQGDGFTSLDGLRSGDVGEEVPRHAVSAASLFTNNFLPTDA